MPSIFAGLRDRHTSSALQSRQATDVYMQMHEWTPRQVKDRCIDNRPLEIRIASVLSPRTANKRLREQRGDSFPRRKRKLCQEFRDPVIQWLIPEISLESSKQHGRPIPLGHGLSPLDHPEKLLWKVCTERPCR